MLKKIYKLNTQEIKFLFNKQGVFFVSSIKKGDFFNIKFFSFKNINKEISNFKFGVFFIKNSFKGAVKRNQTKRRIFSIIESYIKTDNFINKTHKDNLYFYLVYPKKEIQTLKFDTVKNHFYDMMEDIINNNK